MTERDDLVERVGRLIADAIFGPGHADIYFDPGRSHMPNVRRSDCERAARAVIPIVGEACASLIEATTEYPSNPEAGDYGHCITSAAFRRRAGNAIRAATGAGE